MKKFLFPLLFTCSMLATAQTQSTEFSIGEEQGLALYGDLTFFFFPSDMANGSISLGHRFNDWWAIGVHLDAATQDWGYSGIGPELKLFYKRLQLSLMPGILLSYSEDSGDLLEYRYQKKLDPYLRINGTLRLGGPFVIGATLYKMDAVEGEMFYYNNDSGNYDLSQGQVARASSPWVIQPFIGLRFPFKNK